MSRTVNVAAAQYDLSAHADLASYEEKITRWVDEAVGKGAEILVFPEYGAMELASLGGREIAGDLERSLHEIARHEDARDALHVLPMNASAANADIIRER